MRAGVSPKVAHKIVTLGRTWGHVWPSAYPEGEMGDHRHVAAELERLASELHDAAFDFMEPARSLHYAELRIARVERIANSAREIVRGRQRSPSSVASRSPA